MGLVYGGQGVVPSARGQATTVISLSAGQSELIPAGSWGVGTGLYSEVQEYDPVTGEMFGLVKGFKDELGYFSFHELAAIRDRMGLGIERDLSWRPTPMSKIKSGEVS